MKTKIFMGALVALLAVACAKEQIPEQKKSSIAEGLVVSASVEQPGDGTKTSLDGLNVKWSVGDRIYLTDGTNAAIYQATTASSSTSFSYVSGDTTLEGNVYAYYPAENVAGFSGGTFTATIPAVQPYVAGGFADGVNPMTAKATVTEGSLVLSFKNVMSFVKLQIVDNAAGKTLTSLSLTSPLANLCGPATVTVGDGGVATTAITSGEKTVKLSNLCAPLTTVATPLYIAVPTGNLGTLTITAETAESDGCWSQDKTAASALSAARSSINSYNPMQISSFVNKTRIAELPANCYMVDATTQTSINIPLSQAIDGWTAIKALEPATDLEGMTTKITSGTRTINVRWFDGASGTIALPETNGIDAEKMTLTFSGCSNGSNAVVDLKNSDEIVWSWHIWFTDYKPAATQAATVNGQVHTYSGPAFQEGGLYYGKVIMDRNLGATVTDITGAISKPTADSEAPNYWGLYYQFGRKDPFATLLNLPSSIVTKTQQFYQWTTIHPEIFVAASRWTALEGTINPWNSMEKKSSLDPCPAGWRVPVNDTEDKNNVWAGLTTANYVDGAGLTKGFLWNDAWIPCSGGRQCADGACFRQGERGYYWSATPYISSNSMYACLYQEKVSYKIASTSSGMTGYAMAVRCVKE